MRQSYFVNLLANEVKSKFPGINRIKNEGLKKSALMFSGVLMLPVLLYNAYVEFRIPYLELVITPKCNLRCKDCANLMPLYENSRNTDVEDLKKSLDLLFGVTKKISLLTIIGGEPFMHPQMHEIIEYAAASGRVKRFQVITNGGILPREANVKALKRENLYVSISAYDCVDRTGFIEMLEKEKINYKLNRFESWSDFGSMEKRNFSLNELKRSYNLCPASNCKTLYNGELFACPRSAHGRVLGLISSDNNEAVTLAGKDKKQLKKQIKKLYSVEFIDACDHCNPEWDRPDIGCGIQIIPNID